MKTGLCLCLGGVMSLGAVGAAKAGDDRYDELRDQVLAQEAAKQENIPAHQILYELGWMRGGWPGSPLIQQRTDALAAAVKDPANLGRKDFQSPETGLWGQWYTQGFFKLDASYEEISRLESEHRTSAFPCRFLDAINSPERLTAQLDRLLITDRSSGGPDRRREFNESISAWVRLIHRHWPSNYAYHPQLHAALIDWLMNTARDPATGYWGERYRHGTRIVPTTDLSITFHIVSYLDGDVPDWPKLIATTLAIKDHEYPRGWLSEGAYLNHNNLDVARLFELGWAHASEPQRAAMRVELQTMLDWCVRESLRPDGSFAMKPDDDSVETSEYFGALFLVRVGYFDRSRRFWTDEDFPNAAADRTRVLAFISSHLNSGGEGGAYYRTALAALSPGSSSPSASSP